MRRCLFLLTALSASCATADSASESVGNRIRVRIEGRGHEKSITTADYFLYLLVRGPDGKLSAARVYAPETAESEGLALMIGKRIETLCGLPRVELVETLHGDACCAQDIVLAPGHTLCREPGTYYAYRIIDDTRRMAADRAAEIRLGMITADGSRYVDLDASDGPEIERAADPPAWPPAGAK